MDLPDVNVLIYAFRSDAPLHERGSAWLTGALRGDARFGVSPLALSALVRITTNSRFYQPNSHDEAFGFCQALLDHPLCRVIDPGDGHWDIFRRLCVEADITGSRVSDAWYAALAIEHGCEWITMDRDFRRFPGLKWREP